MKPYVPKNLKNSNNLANIDSAIVHARTFVPVLLHTFNVGFALLRFQCTMVYCGKQLTISPPFKKPSYLDPYCNVKPILFINPKLLVWVENKWKKNYRVQIVKGVSNMLFEVRRLYCRWDYTNKNKPQTPKVSDPFKRTDEWIHGPINRDCVNNLVIFGQ